MTALVNGRFVENSEASISIFDRGFLYGDGLFETMRIYSGRPFRWGRHLARLQQGADFLGIKIPFSSDKLRDYARQLIQRNSLAEGILRLTVTRGAGAPGYSIRELGTSSLVMIVFPLRSTGELVRRWDLVTSSYRVPSGDHLSQVKSCNQLLHILVRAEAEQKGAHEGLILNTDGFVTEAAASNLFWLEDETIYTPPLSDGLLPGVTRELILELCVRLGIKTAENSVTPAGLQASDGIFMTVSSLELVEVGKLDGVTLPEPARLDDLRKAYHETVRQEVAAD